MAGVKCARVQSRAQPTIHAAVSTHATVSDTLIGIGARAAGADVREFTLKSGRVSPYFFNAGKFCSGAALWQLARCYAETLRASGVQFDVLFGRRYKAYAGSTRVCTCGTIFAGCPYAYNRKEAKDHGEGGTLVGAKLSGVC